jgi:hypothetical protein
MRPSLPHALPEGEVVYHGGMNRTSFLALLVLVVALGAGCFDPLPSSNSSSQTPVTPQPLRGVSQDATPDLRVENVLGIQFPSDGASVYKDSSAPKQEGALFYGQSYRLIDGADASDALIGRIQILNLTDPYRNMRTLVDPMKSLLGCGGEDRKFGPSCEFGKVATTTVNGLAVLAYPVTYYPRRLNDTEAFTTATVYLVPVPQNNAAWLYVFPVDLENATKNSAVSEWVKNVAPLR